MNSEKIRNLILCAMFAALTAVGAFIKIPVPLVPFTLQLTFTTLAGYILGAKNGMISVLIYIALGLIGIPVFTEGGGIGYVLKPTFGYIIGFALGAFVTGTIARKNSRPSYPRLLAAGFAGLAVVYAMGILYYYLISRFYLGADVTVRSVLLYCFVLVVPGDIALTFVAALAAKRIIPVVAAHDVGRRKGDRAENE
ncbi:MAG: biotin transporter BioY [Ruminococcus sp.]|nr:biotin transporter BioY [Ruminococcus sp.]